MKDGKHGSKLKNSSPPPLGFVSRRERRTRKKGRKRIVGLKDARIQVSQGKKGPWLKMFQFAFNVEMRPFFLMAKLFLLA
jgi:hypothetical protein